jgi:hypothetical protein
MRAILTYDVFSGSREQNPLWLESVEGLERACETMRQRAALSPGPYFVFCVASQKVLASTDTSTTLHIEKKSHAVSS